MNQIAPSFIKESELQKEADIALRENWMNDIVFTWHWWLLVALFIIPWLVWWKVVDRKKIFEILTYGFMVMIMSSLFDAIGVENDLWEYHYQFIPLLDVFIVYDVSVIPVTYMLIYQYFSTWKSFTIASIVVSGMFSFVSEPILVWLNYHDLFKWEYFYSFPIFIVIAITLKYLIIKIKKVSIINKV
ncbi:MAG: hypothetical protein A4E53_01296 [Pelotomaculum sp. PtaB.Bin104]|nr:MAG: hypothetical protein A4E53_01296 [Pelotomaculum sp. PtaB.Bin104]